MDQQTSPLVCPSHTTHYAVAVIVGLVIGVGASSVFFKQSPSNTYQAGFEAAKKRVEGSPMGMMLISPDDIRSLSGTVTAVDGNRVMVHMKSSYPFDDPALDDRIIVINSDTRLTKLIKKDPNVLQAEMEAYMKAMAPGKPTPQFMGPPESFSREAVDVSGIAVGDTINITTVENIKNTKECLASDIQIEPRASN